MRSREFKDVWLVLLFGFALALRLTFSFAEIHKLPKVMRTLTTTDSFSYTESIKSFINGGEYWFDSSHPESKYGRLPGYPLFWGAHYLTFGEDNAYKSVAITQAILDSFLVFLIFSISYFLTKSELAAYFTALIYSLNPIAIYWVSITGTETLGVFLSVLFFYVLFTKKKSRWYFVWIGLIGVSAFYVRPYLALLMVSAVLYFLMERLPLKKIAVSMGLFGLIFAIWPIRNYLESGKLILVKTSSSGYHRYGSDVSAARQYIFTWTTEFDVYMDRYLESGELNLPPEAIPKGYQESDILGTFNKAAECGSGFNYWRDGVIILNSNCNAEVKKEFDQYREALYQSRPLYSMTFVPIQNWKKALFKSQTVNGSAPITERIIFLIRSLILVLSITGLILFKGMSKERLALGVFILLIYLLITTVIRQVEMRYLIQADAILLVSFSMIVAQIERSLQKQKSNFGT